MNIRSLAIATACSLGAASLAGPAFGQQSSSGYWSGSATWKNSAGQCWRSGYADSSTATSECDPELVRKPAPVAPAPAPVVEPRAAPTPPPPPAPVAKPAPPKPSPLNVTLTDTFASGSAALSPQLRGRLDKDVIAKLGEFASISAVNVEGHTDRLGSTTSNQRLSERRADAVAAYLATKGVDKNKISTIGWGKIYPVKACPDQKDRKALAECLTPNRRVSVEVSGVRK